MQQLTQKLKNGKMTILDVPAPGLKPGCLLVKNYYSLVSAGTEGSTVRTARKGFVGKAKERPQQVRQVIDTLKTQGPVQTYRAVMKKLDAHSPLGYSCVGEVIKIGENVGGYVVGDKVACGGLTASHAEIVSVPVNLCVKLSPDTDMKQAAYNTLGAIAMQGVRQADLRLGETCAVIGLGLLGQLTALLLKASGVKVVGVDIDPAMVEIASSHCIDLALSRNAKGIQDKILHSTGGMGCDAVIITAASSSLDPVNFAGAIARKRGRVVIVGDVPTGFDREPHYYKKELELKMSCSYGPGRYDPVYEDKGCDYPAAYVRWTEQRNMAAFQELILKGRIDLSYLTTHLFKLEDAPDAYNMIMEGSDAFIGILIEYDRQKKFNREKFVLKDGPPMQPGRIGIGFIGAGSYAQSHLLPNIPDKDTISLNGVMTSRGTTSRSVAERFRFSFCTEKLEDILDNGEINTVFIATPHDSHAGYVIEAIEKGKHVFVEKPLCLTPEELIEIAALVKTGGGGPHLMVGYNRRFSPLAVKLKNCFQCTPVAMTYRINAGSIPPDSWIQDMETGGGRIIGEVCHFIDFLTFINGSLPVSLHGYAMEDAHGLNDIVTVSLKYENGSIGSVQYFSNGDKSLAKERVEVHGSGVSAVLDDFKHLTVYSGGNKKKDKLMNQNKGQKEEVRSFLNGILKGDENLIPYDQLYSTSLASFGILESLRDNRAVTLALPLI